MRLKVVTGAGKAFFQPNLRKKFKLTEYKLIVDRKKPLLVYGCGSSVLKHQVMCHSGFCLIVWTGSDTLKLREVPAFVAYCKANTHRVFHITYSQCCKVDLEHFGIPYESRLVISRDHSNFTFEERPGTTIYHYGGKKRPWYYGTPVVQQIEKQLRDKVCFTYASFGTYAPEEIQDVYAAALLGIRLTEHDGTAGSVIEMGLMGRRTIFNGEQPCAIPYSPYPYKEYTPRCSSKWMFQDKTIINRVMELIEHELQNRPAPDKLLAEEMKEYVHDDLKWLDTKYYV